MKIFKIEDYIETANNDIEGLMLKEYDFYRSIVNNVELNGNNYQVCKRVNFQCRTTLSCNASCSFCIEKDNIQKERHISDEKYIQALDNSLSMLSEQGIFPTVTITGGEPCLFKQRLFGIFDILQKHKVKKFNVNTNGSVLSEEMLLKMVEVKMPHLNISRHHYVDSKNNDSFNKKTISTEGLKNIKQIIGGTYYDTTRVRFQCVMIKNYIDSFEEVKKYLNHILELGFDNVAFRGLSKLKEEDGYNQELHEYCEENQVDMFSILRYLQHDPDFKLNAQNISDHYMYEDWVYKGKVDVHFAYSDMELLKKYEVNELQNNELFAREFVLYEDGSFCSGWNKDIKLIKQYS